MKKKFEKSLTMPKKTEREGPLGFLGVGKNFSTTYAIVLFFSFFFLPTFS